MFLRYREVLSTRDTLNLKILHVKLICIVFDAEAEPFTTANVVLADVFLFHIFITQLKLSLPAVGFTRRISGFIIFYQVVGHPIFILHGTYNFFL
jgi:hypothetical protein